VAAGEPMKPPLLCRIGLHKWRLVRDALNGIMPDYWVCDRCAKLDPVLPFKNWHRPDGSRP
jgi:hypothetical protein